VTLHNSSKKLKPISTDSSLIDESFRLLDTSAELDSQENGRQRKSASRGRKVLQALLSVLVFSSLNYVVSNCQIWQLEEHPFLQGFLMVLIEEIFRHCESKLTK
jgi:hypothetical protein